MNEPRTTTPKGCTCFVHPLTGNPSTRERRDTCPIHSSETYALCVGCQQPAFCREKGCVQPHDKRVLEAAWHSIPVDLDHVPADYDEAVEMLRRVKRDRTSSATHAPNVDGRDFYELCQQYRHARHDPIVEFTALQNYILTGELPWPSYEDARTDRGVSNV